MTHLFNRKVAAAVRSEADLRAALNSKVDLIFLLRGNILTLQSEIDKIHEAGKFAMVHLDFLEGVGKDRAGLEYLKCIGIDGVLTTKTSMIRPAKDLGIYTIQRFFIIDSHSIDTAAESVKIAKPDCVEVMPGVVVKKIEEFSKRVKTPILAGGLIETEEEVDSVIKAGAEGVSTANVKLWDYK